MITFDSQGWNNNQVLTSNLTIGNYNFSSDNNFYTNYGYNFNVNQSSLYYVFQNPNSDKITITTKDNSLTKFLGVDAYQVSETSTQSLIIEGWNSSTKLYSKSFSNLDSWQTLSLNFDNINKVIIRLPSSSTTELTDYNFDNFSFQTTTSTLSLISPTNGSTGVSISPTFNWSSVSGASSYRLQVSTSSSFGTSFYDNSGISANSKQVSGLSTNTKYYWRVNASSSSGTSSWTSIYSFTTQSSTNSNTSGNYTEFNTEKGTFNGDIRLKTKTGSIGSKVIYFLNTSSTAKYTVNLDKSGQWYAWGRMFFESSGSPRSTFYIQVDNGPKLIFGGNNNSFDKWHWEGSGLSKLSLGNLSSGNHIITVYGVPGESGETVLLDQILLTSDASLVASDNLSQGTQNGNLINSANSAAISGDALLKTKSGSIGPKVLYFLNTYSPAKFTVNLTQSGQWYAWGRMFFESSGSPRSSFYIQVDNGPKLTFGGNDNSFDKWHWEGSGLSKLSLGNLSSGSHTITIYGRGGESGPTVMLDQLLLTSDPSLAATDNVLNNSSNNGDIIFAAENSTLNGDVHLKTESGSIGNKIIYFLNTYSTAKFTVNFSQSGQWYTWGRMFFQSSGSPRGTFYIQVDNNSKLLFGGNDNSFDKWHWEGNGLSKLSLGNLSSGNHTITISGVSGESGETVMLDQILFTTNASLIPTDNTIFSKTESDSTDLNQSEIKTPKNFLLSQNYPNPFNPTTSIQYTVISNQFVSLKVYDILGNVVATLVDDNKPAGTYEVKFDATNLASGIYFYKLIADGFVSTKKMIMLK